MGERQATKIGAGDGDRPSSVADGPAMPTGIRLAAGEPLVFADAGDLHLTMGEWVLVVDGAAERVGEVVVVPDQVVESTVAEWLPRVTRRAQPTEIMAAAPAGAGLVLLRSLELPAWAVARSAVAGDAIPTGDERQADERQGEDAHAD